LLQSNIGSLISLGFPAPLKKLLLTSGSFLAKVNI
jgi:hypothetical protein